MIPEARPDFACPDCGDTFIVTGDTDLARARALRDWPGCCTKTTPSTTDNVVEGAPEATRGDCAPVAELERRNQVSDRDSRPGFLHRLRAWWATWPFAADEFTA